MKKLIVLLLVLACILVVVGCLWLFDSQYNKNGVSHFLNITIDENRPKEYVGELDSHRVFTEKLDLDSTYFINVKNEHISIREAIDQKLVSIGDWRKYAWKRKKEGDAEILQYENYEIVITYDECIIKPFSNFKEIVD